MSYNRAYTEGDVVQVDSYTPGLNPFPTLGRCTIRSVVLASTSAATDKVHVLPDGYEPLHVYKDRVTP